MSIGFNPLEYSWMDEGGMRFIQSEVLELSLVTIPANAEATINTIRSIDRKLRAASGQVQASGVRVTPPGATGSPKLKPNGARAMKTIAEQIAAFEAARQAKAARMEELMNTASEKGETLDAEQAEEYDGLEAEVKSVDTHLKRLRAMEQSKATNAVRITAEVGGNQERSTEARATHIQVRAAPALKPGIAFARLAKIRAVSGLDHEPALVVATRMYGADSEIAQMIKAAVDAGGNTAGNWAANLVGAETNIFADFAAFLRPSTILGKFGQGNVPSLRSVPFRVPLISQTGGGAGYWVGEGKAKPLTSFDFARTTLQPLKVANIAVVTEESIRDSSPSSEAIIRDALRDALAARLDTDFVDPAKAASAGVSPASITNGAAAIASTGTDADAVRLDVRAVYAKFIAASNAPTTGVWIMSATNALALSLMVNALGQKEFPDITMQGGMFEGLPAIISEYAGAVVVLANASDIYEADEGGVAVDMSREASLEMSDAPAANSLTGTGAQLVSMFQTNSVALRAERTINWSRRRPSGVAYLTAVHWGGAVPAS